jgi:hypothetical protein
VGDIDRQFVRVALDADGRVDALDARGHVDAGRADHVSLEKERAVADADLADLQRAARLRLVGIRRLRLDQVREVPAFGGLLDPDDRLVQPDVVEDHVAANHGEHVVVERQVLHADDGLAVLRDVHVFQFHAEEQVTVQATDRQPAVHVILRLADDEAAEPFLEPRRLRDDDRHGGDPDHERADEGDNLKRSAGNGHQNA